MTQALFDAFPRRPIAPAGADKLRKSGRLWLIGGLLLLLVPLYVGYAAWQRVSLRSDLAARGVSADVLDADGSCNSRRGVSLGCTYSIRYRLRPEEGGGEREGSVYVPGDGPRIFAPPARYDPQNPDRIMSEADLDRGEPVMNVAVPVVLFGGLALLSLLVWYAGGNRILTAAAAAPRPVLLPVTSVENVPNTTFVRAHFKRPDGSAAKQDFNKSAPLLVQSPSGESVALALLGPKERPVLLSHDLSELDLSGDERAAILAAARG